MHGIVVAFVEGRGGGWILFNRCLIFSLPVREPLSVIFRLAENRKS